ncbi:MAG TPA: chemotaxis protein CheA [Bacteroidota bacterium]|nr:chemotaxis protein CheA [Bacteroidota bacterium]
MATEKSSSEGNQASHAFDGEMAEILESFIVESNEILEKLGQNLLELEKNPADSELHNVIFRAVHTLKGTSSFLGFEQTTALAHSFEDVLNKIRKGELKVSSEKMDVMFEAYDLLKELMHRIENHINDPLDLAGVMLRLDAISANRDEGISAGRERGTQPASADTRIPGGEQQQAETAAASEHEEKSTHELGSAQIAASSMQAKSGDSTIRVDVARLDALMNLVGELVLGRNRLSQVAHQLNEEYEGESLMHELGETNAHIDFITTELQMAVMKTRMVPIAKVFNKLPRLVRELSKETGKEIELKLEGEETELDKSLIEELNDPLIHLLRNSADHGIEVPSERARAGKVSKGTITVRAEQEGNHMVISIHDDGHGMDPETLKAKAVEKGMITETQAREMTQAEAFNLIFAPGFSTAQKVTNVSGRGVGMDVVRTNVEKLKGNIQIQSELNVGTKIIIKLPLTLAIIQALLVEAKKEIFSIPLDSVREVVRVNKKEIATISGSEVIRLRDSVLPLAHLSRVLGSGSDQGCAEWMYIVVVGVGEKNLGIVVDSLLGQKEVVIKTIGEYLGNVRGIAGSTILGDGRVIMIIDIGELMKLCSEQPRAMHAEARVTL